MAQPVDLLVDRRVLLDVEVLGRDVGLGLVVVVVGDEVLDRVVGEERAELVAQLRGQRLVVGDDERRALHALDDARHRHRLAGAGGARAASTKRLAGVDALGDARRSPCGWSAAGVKMGSRRNSGTNLQDVAAPADGICVRTCRVEAAPFGRSRGARACRGSRWPPRRAPGPSPASRRTPSSARRAATPSTASSAPSGSSTSPRWASARSSAPGSSSSSARRSATPGPSIIISFALAGVTCLFSAFSYAELASSIPVSGSAYTYGYATLGELVAWIIGWDLILEYGVSVAAVAVGWGGYLKSLLDSLFGINLPDSIAGPPGDGGTRQPAGGLPRARGDGAADLRRARERAHEHGHGRPSRSPSSSSSSSSASARSTATTSRRGRPTAFNGTVDAAALIFFAYIGFDAISTSGEEAENPSRDLPYRDHRRAADLHAALHRRRVVTVGLAPAEQAGGLRRAAGRGAARSAPASATGRPTSSPSER